VTARNAKSRCPTCRAVALKEGNTVFPFCSERCQLVDLGRWLAEDYRIPAEEPDASGGGVESVNPRTDDEN
jgi:endogenous inhibitor of DNA gyrase (YacG/DUF329 family)